MTDRLDIFPVSVVYDDPIHMRNLTACDRWVTPGTRLVHDTWVHADWHDDLRHWTIYALSSRPDSYLYPIGCFNAPHDWGGMPIIGGQHGQVLLDFAPPEIMQDARQGRVLFILDQSQEGNANKLLWEWLHSHCATHGIAASQIVYMTGDQLAEEDYGSWCSYRGINDRVHVISSWLNQHALSRNLTARHLELPPMRRSVPKWLYNCLNRMPHEHRKQLWMALWRSDLLNQGLVSMPSWDTGYSDATSRLPMIVDHADFSENWYNDINPWIYEQSLISVITETYVDDNQLLIGEKVFKPMWCSSPFMVLGTRGTLAVLRRNGFKTFDGIWDEVYDTLPDTTQRIAAIINQLQRLLHQANMQDLLDELAAVTSHNLRAVQQQWPESPEYQRLIDVWRNMRYKFADRRG